MIWLAAQLWPAALISLVLGFVVTWSTVVKPRENVMAPREAKRSRFGRGRSGEHLDDPDVDGSDDAGSDDDGSEAGDRRSVGDGAVFAGRGRDRGRVAHDEVAAFDASEGDAVAVDDDLASRDTTSHARPASGASSSTATSPTTARHVGHALGAARRVDDDEPVLPSRIRSADEDELSTRVVSRVTSRDHEVDDMRDHEGDDVRRIKWDEADTPAAERDTAVSRGAVSGSGGAVSPGPMSGDTEPRGDEAQASARTGSHPFDLRGHGVAGHEGENAEGSDRVQQRADVVEVDEAHDGAGSRAGHEDHAADEVAVLDTPSMPPASSPEPRRPQHRAVGVGNAFASRVEE